MSNSTELFNAVQESKRDAVTALLSNDAELVNAKDKFGNTPLHFVMEKDANDEIVNYLIEHGATT